MASSASLESSEAATIDGLIFSKLQATISLPLSLLSTQSQNKVMILVVASLLNTFLLVHDPVMAEAVVNL